METERQNWGPCQCGWDYQTGYPEGHETWCQCQCWDCRTTKNDPWSAESSGEDDGWGDASPGEVATEKEVAARRLAEETEASKREEKHKQEAARHQLDLMRTEESREQLAFREGLMSLGHR